eukprot:2692755-Amphidinium_carterae.1
MEMHTRIFWGRSFAVLFVAMVSSRLAIEEAQHQWWHQSFKLDLVKFKFGFCANLGSVKECALQTLTL